MSSTTIRNDFGEVSHSTILELLEHDLTYADLKKFAKDKTATSYLEVVEIEYENHSLYSIMINRVYVMDNQQFNNGIFHNFVYKLEELRDYFKGEEDEDEDGNELLNSLIEIIKKENN